MLDLVGDYWIYRDDNLSLIEDIDRDQLGELHGQTAT